MNFQLVESVSDLQILEVARRIRPAFRVHLPRGTALDVSKNVSVWGA